MEEGPRVSQPPHHSIFAFLFSSSSSSYGSYSATPLCSVNTARKSTHTHTHTSATTASIHPPRIQFTDDAKKTLVPPPLRRGALSPFPTQQERKGLTSFQPPYTLPTAAAAFCFLHSSLGMRSSFVVTTHTSFENRRGCCISLPKDCNNTAALRRTGFDRANTHHSYRNSGERTHWVALQTTLATHGVMAPRFGEVGTSSSNQRELLFFDFSA